MSISIQIPPVQRKSQRGSALLVVLVLAAIVAIMLYRELPIAAFEAQRQKEALVISRGNEYKRGIKLFVRKVGRFPASMEELESTNRMRFLRHRYVDPLTGKDDWRIVHAGPGGTIIDSKVQGKTDSKSSALGQGAVFAGFNNTFTGDLAGLTDTEPANVGLRQRPAATKNAASADGSGLALPQGAIDPALQDSNGTSATAAEMTQLQQGQGLQVAPGQAQPGVIQPDGTQPGQNSGGATTAQVFNAQPAFDPATGQAYTPGQVPPGQAPPGQAQPGPAAGTLAQPGGGIGSLAQQLNNVNPRTPEQAQAQQSAFGGSTLGGPANVVQGAGAGNGQVLAAGGIAGVASIAKGKSIKTVNDQTKYSLWEFYYDLRKEQNAGAGQQGAGQPGLQQGSPQRGQQTGLQQTGFGSSSGTQSGFGQSSAGFGQTTGPAQDPTQPPQQTSTPQQQ